MAAGQPGVDWRGRPGAPTLSGRMPPAAPPAALVEGLTDFCTALLKAQQDFRRYPRNNPILARRLD